LQDAFGKAAWLTQELFEQKIGPLPTNVSMSAFALHRVSKWYASQIRQSYRPKCEALGTTGQIVWHFRNCEQLTLNPNSASAPSCSKKHGPTESVDEAQGKRTELDEGTANSKAN
jgi:hypothetical protein